MGFQILAQFRWGMWGFHRFYGVPTHNLHSVCQVSPNSLPIHQQGTEAGGRRLQLSWSEMVVVHSLVGRIQFNNVFGPELFRSSFPQLLDEDRKRWLCPGLIAPSAWCRSAPQVSLPLCQSAASLWRIGTIPLSLLQMSRPLQENHLWPLSSTVSWPFSKFLWLLAALLKLQNAPQSLVGLFEMQILTCLVWNGAWDTAFLTNSLVIRTLLGQDHTD